jgi:hypothetical protein
VRERMELFDADRQQTINKYPEARQPYLPT